MIDKNNNKIKFKK